MTNPARLLGLLSLATLLGWAIWEARLTPQPLSAIATATPDETPTPQTPAAHATPIGDYTATLMRPLFYPGRITPTAETVAAPTPGVAPSSPGQSAARLTLSAIIEEDGRRSALLIAPGQTTSTRLQEGESIGGWQLDKIGDDTVSVTSNGRQETLPLRHFDAAPPPRPTPTTTNRGRTPRVIGGIKKPRKTE